MAYMFIDIYICICVNKIQYVKYVYSVPEEIIASAAL